MSHKPEGAAISDKFSRDFDFGCDEDEFDTRDDQNLNKLTSPSEEEDREEDEDLDEDERRVREMIVRGSEQDEQTIVALARSGELRDYETVWYDGRLYDLLLSALKRAWTAYDEVKQCMKQTSRSIRARAPANTVTAESGHLVPANLKKAPLPPTQRAVAHGIPTALLSSPTSPSSQPCTTPLIQHSSGNIDAEVLAKHTQMLNSLLYAYDAIKKVIMAPEVVEGVATGLCEGKHIKVSSTLERQHHHTSQKMSSPFSSTTPHSSSLTASSSTRRHLMDGGFIGKLISRLGPLPPISGTPGSSQISQSQQQQRDLLITVGLKPADETDATLDADVRESRAITDLLSKIFLRFRSLSRPIKAHLAAYSVAAATRGAQGVGDALRYMEAIVCGFKEDNASSVPHHVPSRADRFMPVLRLLLGQSTPIPLAITHASSSCSRSSSPSSSDNLLLSIFCDDNVGMLPTLTLQRSTHPPSSPSISPISAIVECLGKSAPAMHKLLSLLGYTADNSPYATISTTSNPTSTQLGAPSAGGSVSCTSMDMPGGLGARAPASLPLSASAGVTTGMMSQLQLAKYHEEIHALFRATLKGHDPSTQAARAECILLLLKLWHKRLDASSAVIILHLVDAVLSATPSSLSTSTHSPSSLPAQSSSSPSFSPSPSPRLHLFRVIIPFLWPHLVEALSSPNAALAQRALQLWQSPWFSALTTADPFIIDACIPAVVNSCLGDKHWNATVLKMRGNVLRELVSSFLSSPQPHMSSSSPASTSTPTSSHLANHLGSASDLLTTLQNTLHAAQANHDSFLLARLYAFTRHLETSLLPRLALIANSPAPLSSTPATSEPSSCLPYHLLIPPPPPPTTVDTNSPSPSSSPSPNTPTSSTSTSTTSPTSGDLTGNLSSNRQSLSSSRLGARAPAQAVGVSQDLINQAKARASQLLSQIKQAGSLGGRPQQDVNDDTSTTGDLLLPWFAALLAVADALCPPPADLETNLLALASRTMAVIPSPLPPAQQYTDFIFGNQLGAGSFAAVMEVTHIARGLPQALWKKYAAKVVHYRILRASLQATLAAQRETQALRLFSHPHCVTLVAECKTAAAQYLILECGTGDLRSALDKCGPLHPLPAAFVVAEVCAALEYIHSLGYVYRDLKPENALLLSNHHIKLSDFGSAAPAKEAMADSQIEGTAEYIAPEVALYGSSAVSPAADLWSLGCFIFELLRGYPLLALDDDEDNDDDDDEIDDGRINDKVNNPDENKTRQDQDKNAKTVGGISDDDADSPGASRQLATEPMWKRLTDRRAVELNVAKESRRKAKIIEKSKHKKDATKGKSHVIVREGERKSKGLEGMEEGEEENDLLIHEKAEAHALRVLSLLSKLDIEAVGEGRSGGKGQFTQLVRERINELEDGGKNLVLSLLRRDPRQRLGVVPASSSEAGAFELTVRKKAKKDVMSDDESSALGQIGMKDATSPPSSDSVANDHPMSEGDNLERKWYRIDYNIIANHPFFNQLALVDMHALIRATHDAQHKEDELSLSTPLATSSSSSSASSFPSPSTRPKPKPSQILQAVLSHHKHLLNLSPFQSISYKPAITLSGAKSDPSRGGTGTSGGRRGSDPRWQRRKHSMMWSPIPRAYSMGGIGGASSRFEPLVDVEQDSFTLSMSSSFKQTATPSVTATSHSPSLPDSTGVHQLPSHSRPHHRHHHRAIPAKEVNIELGPDALPTEWLYFAPVPGMSIQSPPVDEQEDAEPIEKTGLRIDDPPSAVDLALCSQVYGRNVTQSFYGETGLMGIADAVRRGEIDFGSGSGLGMGLSLGISGDINASGKGGTAGHTPAIRFGGPRAGILGPSRTDGSTTTSTGLPPIHDPNLRPPLPGSSRGLRQPGPSSRSHT